MLKLGSADVLLKVLSRTDSRGRLSQVGCLAGAAHLLNYTAGVTKLAQRGKKSHVVQRGQCLLDFDFQYEYKLRKHGLSIL